MGGAVGNEVFPRQGPAPSPPWTTSRSQLRSDRDFSLEPLLIVFLGMFLVYNSLDEAPMR